MVAILILIVLTLILFSSSKKIASIKKGKNVQKRKSELSQLAEDAIQFIKGKTNQHLNATYLSEQEIRDQIIYLYGLLIKTNSLIGVPRPLNMTPDEYFTVTSRDHKKYEKSLHYVTAVYNKVFYGNQIPQFDVFSVYVKAIDASIIGGPIVALGKSSRS